jgi:hypothetical protein
MQNVPFLLVVKFVSSEVASGPAGFHDALKIHEPAFPALSRDTGTLVRGMWPNTDAVGLA